MLVPPCTEETDSLALIAAMAQAKLPDDKPCKKQPLSTNDVTRLAFHLEVLLANEKFKHYLVDQRKYFEIKNGCVCVSKHGRQLHDAWLHNDLSPTLKDVIHDLPLPE